MIYLDNAASTPLLPEVMVKLATTLDTYGNPSSMHSEGFKANRLIEDAKEIIANKLNCYTDELYFTSGATMSNNIVLQGFKGKIYVGATEHEDIQLMKEMFHFREIPVDSIGKINIDFLRDKLDFLADTPALFSIQMANGETGTIQNMKEISDLIHSYPNKYLHTDATQYIPYFEVNVRDLKIDALSMSGQKIGCIKGTGLLYISNKLINHLTPLIYGEQGLIGGTPNVLGIACLGEAFNVINRKIDISPMRNYMIENLNGKLIGSEDNRLPCNVNVMFDNVDSQTFVALLNEYGVCCSAGSACSSGNADPSHTLIAMGMSPEEANCCVRFTIGIENTMNEIENAVKIINSSLDIIRGLNG